MIENSYVRFLSKTSIFSLIPDALDELAPFLEVQLTTPGKPIFNKGDIMDSLVIPLQESLSLVSDDKVFLLLTNTKKIMVDYVTVLLFYGLTVGCEVSWVKNRAYDLTLNEVRRENQLELLEMMSEETLQPSSHLEFALTTLGLNALKTPGELRSLLRWNTKGNSLVNRFGICFMNILNLMKAVR